MTPLFPELKEFLIMCIQMFSLQECISWRKLLALEEETLLFSVEEESFYHINTYMKLLAGLANMYVVIKDEDKASILLSSLPDEGYKTFVLIVINERTSLSYVIALVNLEFEMK